MPREAELILEPAALLRVLVAAIGELLPIVVDLIVVVAEDEGVDSTCRVLNSNLSGL